MGDEKAEEQEIITGISLVFRVVGNALKGQKRKSCSSFSLLPFQGESANNPIKPRVPLRYALGYVLLGFQPDML